MKVPADVRFFGKGGMRASSALCSKELNDLIEFQPHVTFVVLGGNDVKDSCVPHTIFSDIKNVVRTLHDYGISRVYVCEIIPRGNFKKAPGITETRFNAIMKVINKKLKKEYGHFCVNMSDIKYPI